MPAKSQARIRIDLQPATLYYIDAFLSGRLKCWFVWSQDSLLQTFGHLCLQVFGPVANEEQAALDYVKLVLMQ